MKIVVPLVLGLFALAAPPGALGAQGPCTLVALTDTVGAFSEQPSFAGDVIAFDSNADLVGENADGNFEVYVIDLAAGAAIRQLTHSTGAVYSVVARTDGHRVAFESNADLLGNGNPDGSGEIFVYDLAMDHLVQLTHGAENSFSASVDGDLVAFASFADLTGHNADGNSEIFLYDLASSTLSQITDTPSGAVGGVRVAGERVAFVSSADVLGNGSGGHYEVYLYDRATGVISQITDLEGNSQNPAFDGSRILFDFGPPTDFEIYLYDLAEVELSRLTHTPGRREQTPDVSGGFAAFGSEGDPLGTNADGNWELFVYDLAEQLPVQVTHTSGGSESILPSIEGSRVAFTTDTDPTGSNPDGNNELFLADCSGLITPPPPDGPWLTSGEVPGFRFKVRIAGPGGSYRAGAKVPACIGETLCVSGALPGRSEAFLRIVGPKPNGKLWPTLVKFSTAQVEIWVQQLGTGALRYYVLEGARPGFDLLPGLFDRQGFTPAGESVAAAPDLGVLSAPRFLAPQAVGPWLTSPELPGFRFRVTIDDGAGAPRAAALEDECIQETACLSGALPGRSELFLRIVGPKPNGFLWPTLVKFSTSAIDVVIQQLGSGEEQTYHLEGATPGHDDLTGLFDRTGFLP